MPRGGRTAEQRDWRERALARALELLAEAAQAGQACPPNAVLAAQLGCTPSCASYLLGLLEARGHVEWLERHHGRSDRVVRIVATGATTAAPSAASAADMAPPCAVLAPPVPDRAARLPPPMAAPIVPSRTCQFPLWRDEPSSDPRRFCGAPSLPGVSWCARCYPRVFVARAAPGAAAAAQ